MVWKQLYRLIKENSEKIKTKENCNKSPKDRGKESIKILFVCHGNICRSPMAEFLFKKMISDAGIDNQFIVESAATSSEDSWYGLGNPV